jgi:chloramphenicol-sensitive protein RarD
MNRGLLATIAAFLIWGLLPLYLHQLHAVPPTQVMAQRLVWCCVFVLIWLALRGELSHVDAALRNPAVRWRLLTTALLVSTNWLLYVWAVSNNRIVEASLGYFINPLVNVLLGVLVLSERLNRVQWTSVALAATGVAYLTWLGGGLPWIALVLAITFGSYGLIRKTVAVDALSGLGAETLLIAPLGIAWLAWCEHNGSGALGHSGSWVDFLLVASGVVTAVPLALFAYGARRIPYSTVGLIQYIGPTLQLLTGVLLYHEPFSMTKAAGFGLIWAALALYAIDGLLRSRGGNPPLAESAVPAAAE